MARSCAETPEPPARRAVIDMVNAVPSGAWLSPTIMLSPSWSIRSRGHRQADQPAGVLGHEVDRFGGGLLGRHAKVAFILAILVIHQDDHVAAAGFFQRLFNRDEGGLRRVRAWRDFTEHNLYDAPGDGILRPGNAPLALNLILILAQLRPFREAHYGRT